MKLIIGFFLLFSLIYSANAQDFPASNVSSNAWWTCPALVGNSEDARASLFFRNQWPNLGGTYITGVAEFDKSVEKLHGGVGGYFLYDNAADGTLVEWSLNGIYSYIGKINENLTLRAATKLAFGHLHLNTDNLIFGDSIDPRHGFVFSTNIDNININRNYFDLSLSVAADFKKWSLGASVFHLNQPEIGLISDSRRKRSYSFFAGYNLWMMKGEKNTGFSVSPIVYIFNNDLGTYYFAGSNISWNFLYVGFHYRFNENNSDAVIMNAGARTGKFQYGYSYDYTVSKLTNASGGTHEAFLSFYF